MKDATKNKKTVIILAITAIGVLVSAWLGDYAAAIMSTSATAKNGMLCQILILIGIIAGCFLCLLWQELDRRYCLQNPDEPVEEESDFRGGS